MADLIKFSIITCTHNSSDYLKNCINSVSKQSCREFEHIFIDGFSSDSTMEIIKEYQASFPNKVKFFQSKPRGIANAMNLGIDKSSGEYICFLHSDDCFFDSSVLNEIFDIVRARNNPDMIYGKAKFFVPESNTCRIVPHRRIYHKLKYWLLLLTNYIPHQAVFIKKDIFEKYGGFNEQYKNSMDYDLWIRLAKVGISNTFTNKIICNFALRKNSQSIKEKENGLGENQLIIRKHVKSKILVFLLDMIAMINSKRNYFRIP